mgnify:FL=1
MRVSVFAGWVMGFVGFIISIFIEIKLFVFLIGLVVDGELLPISFWFGNNGGLP